MMVAAYKASLQVYDELSQKSPAFRKIYDDMVKFRGDQLLWFQVSEKGYDDFMHTIGRIK
jgi:TRAP-type mannitol/chloroaromatic compound transport system substrate-binding protein